VPRGEPDAHHGRWHRGPGAELFDAVRTEVRPLPVVAENLGLITPAVERLREQLGMPGSVVLQFAFSDNMTNRPPDVVPEDAFVYTGTHDNDTTVGWWHTRSDGERSRVDAELARHNVLEDEPNWKLIHLAMASAARVAMLPAQDVLGLDGGARMNYPGRAAANWQWQLQPGELDAEQAKRLRGLTEAAQRTDTALTLDG
jgi:4-alpha-glucanotransferase